MTLILTAADGYIDEAADALATSNVFVSSEVSGAAALRDTLQQQVPGDSIAIAVFSDNAALEASGPDIVSALAGKTTYDTIIVAVGDDLSAGSRVLESGQAMQIANEAEGSAGSLTDALTETVIGVQTAGDQNVAIPEAGSDGGAIVGIVLASAAVVAAIGVAIGLLVSSRRRRRARADEKLPEGVENQLVVLRSLIPEYAALAASGNAVAARTRDDLDAIVTNTTELFSRIDRRSAEGQLSIAAVEYDDKLRKLTAAVGRDYLLDILTHQGLWDDPDDRVREVSGAVTAVSEELVENIKQVNARRGLHFQVSLDGLIGKRKELQDWEREFNSATGEPDRPQTGA